jgi:hypothetical protein
MFHATWNARFVKQGLIVVEFSISVNDLRKSFMVLDTLNVAENYLTCSTAVELVPCRVTNECPCSVAVSFVSSIASAS